VGSDQTAVKWAGRVHYENRGRTASTLHTHRQASLVVSHYTTLVPPLRLCIGPAREAGLSIGTWRGHVPPHKKKRKGKVGLIVIMLTNKTNTP